MAATIHRAGSVEAASMVAISATIVLILAIFSMSFCNYGKAFYLSHDFNVSNMTKHHTEHLFCWILYTYYNFLSTIFFSKVDAEHPAVPKTMGDPLHGGSHLDVPGVHHLHPFVHPLVPLTRKRSAAPDPEGLDISVNLPFEMLRRRYVQALARGGMGQVRR